MKKGPPQVETLRLDEVVRDVFRLLRHHLDRHAVTVSASYGPGLPAVRGDRVQLQQVVLNLLMNAADAVQALPPGDRLVAVRVARRDDGGVQVTVSDKGRGIPGGHEERVFEPFFTTKAHGMGMGLAISRTIVDEHRGRLWAENAAGGGAAFHLVLPSAG